MEWLLIPSACQAIVMAFDEFYYHHRRGLPRWEAIGHPLDSLVFLACFLFLHQMPFSNEHLAYYIALSTISCLFVAKDEIIHFKLCSAGEMILHAVLFILHPIVLGCAGLIWWLGYDSGILGLAIGLQCWAIAGFAVYQTAFWNWKRE